MTYPSARRSNMAIACLLVMTWLLLGPSVGQPETAVKAASLPAITAGWTHSCLLGADGTITCWGDDADGVLDAPDGQFTEIDAGQRYTCAVSGTDASLTCWGDDRLGLGDVPVGSFRTVSVGADHACAIRTNGSLECWGDDRYGQAAAPDGAYLDISAGVRHSCAISSANEAACWGEDETATTPRPVSGPFDTIVAGGPHSCAAWSGSVRCWGPDDVGEYYIDVNPYAVFQDLSAGPRFTCGLINGQAECWGNEAITELNPPYGPFVDIDAGARHACAVRADETAACWGSNYYNQSTTVTPAPTTYVPIAPTRVLDSRSGFPGPFIANNHRNFQVAGLGDIPADAVGITGNLTVTGQTRGGFATLAPYWKPLWLADGSPAPATSTINFPVGDTRANNVTTVLGSGGDLVLVYRAVSRQSAHFILDVTGYFVADDSGATYNAVDPVRLLDSRSGNGLNGTFAANTPRTWAIAGRRGIPSAAIAVTGNLTVTGQTGAGYVSLGPSATANPTTSTINFPVGDTRANGITAPLSPTGMLSAVYKAAAGSRTHLVFDVTGYYLDDLSGARFYPLEPDRLLDTRVEIGLDGAFVTDRSRSLVATPRVGVPVDAIALTGNVTVVGQTKAGYASLTEEPTDWPLTSTINVPIGDIRANGVTSPIGDDGTVGLVYKASAGATTHLVLDVTGYFR